MKSAIKPQKSFGQHFLTDNQVLEKITTLVNTNKKEFPIIEIGPGMGALTHYLLKENKHITAIEVDKRCVSYLQQHYYSNQLTILEADFLRLDLASILQEDTLFVGNFPYNISSQIIFKLLEVYEKAPVVIGMFQKEMAQRIAATHGNKSYGIISVLAQYMYDIELVFDIPPHSFNPPPKVMSSVIILKRKNNIDTSLNYKLFRTIIKTSFNQRRKMLRSTLKPLISNSNLLHDDFFTKRPEQLSVEEFISLTHRMANNGK